MVRRRSPSRPLDFEARSEAWKTAVQPSADLSAERSSQERDVKTAEEAMIKPVEISGADSYRSPVGAACLTKCSSGRHWNIRLLDGSAPVICLKVSAAEAIAITVTYLHKISGVREVTLEITGNRQPIRCVAGPDSRICELIRQAEEKLRRANLFLNAAECSECATGPDGDDPSAYRRAFLRIAESALANPTAQISELVMLEEDERWRVVEEWNAAGQWRLRVVFWICLLGVCGGRLGQPHCGAEDRCCPIRTWMSDRTGWPGAW
jgi:hypothetical protein